MSKYTFGIAFGITLLLTPSQALATEYIDYGTQRSNMHACQVGSYMTGLHIKDNRFSCTPDFSNYSYGNEWVDQSTQKLGMHVCPDEMAMTGYNYGKNLLLCARFPKALVNETIDTSTQRNSMHSCPMGSIMIGIHAGNNLLLCAWPQFSL